MKLSWLYIAVILASSSYAVAKITVAEEEEIKAKYLECDRAATKDFLSLDESAACSVNYEKLLKEVFSGNFDDFMTWWRSTKSTKAAK